MIDSLIPIGMFAKDKNDNVVSIHLFSNEKDKVWLKIQWPPGAIEYPPGTGNFPAPLTYIEARADDLKETLLAVFDALESCESRRNFIDNIWEINRDIVVWGGGLPHEIAALHRYFSDNGLL